VTESYACSIDLGLFQIDTEVGQCPVTMATSRGSQKSLLHKDHIYDFCIKFLRITGICLPICRESPESVGSTSNNPYRFCLKITLLHGTEQQNIGEFEVIGDECIINHQLSCQIAYGRPDKLHVYIGTIDLYLFLERFNQRPCIA